MSEVVSSNKTIAKNTALLYGRMLFNLVVSLFTSRVNLQVLGIDDNGIYQIVGGVIAMFAFLNGSLAGATSRFLAYDIGRGDTEKLKKTFAAALNVHIIAAMIILIIGETLGLWFVKTQLNIPDGRMFAAIAVYHLSIVGTMISMIQIPFNAAIIAHEKMDMFAYVGMLDVGLKLLACFLLYILPFDKLITYGTLILLFSLLIQLIYYIYCKRHFVECKFRRITEWKIIKPLVSFSGWDMFSNFSLISRNQIQNIFLNQFLGVAMNAAYGFSNIVYGAISGFSKNFIMSVRPPIIKAYSIKDYVRLQELVIDAGKFTFALMLLFIVPFLFESHYIIELWLKTPPEKTYIFCSIQLLICLVDAFLIPIGIAIQATGQNKELCLIHGILRLCVIPLSYLLLYYKFKPESILLLNVIFLATMGIFDFIILNKKIPQISITTILKDCVKPALIVGFCIILLTLCSGFIISKESFLRLLITCAISSISNIILSYNLLMNKNQRQKMKILVLSKFR